MFGESCVLSVVFFSCQNWGFERVEAGFKSGVVSLVDLFDDALVMGAQEQGDLSSLHGFVSPNL